MTNAIAQLIGELTKLTNIPARVNGRALTEVLQTMTAQLNGVEEQLGGIQERLGEIEAHIVVLKTQTRASNANHIVRLHNLLSHSLENHILPLVNATTGEDITICLPYDYAQHTKFKCTKGQQPLGSLEPTNGWEHQQKDSRSWQQLQLGCLIVASL